MNVYFISGLAADYRMFKHIQLPEHCQAIFLEWIPPIENESLQDYAFRLAATINTSLPFAIIGLSMGGMMATEISKKLNPVITILISSVPASSHLPYYFKIARALKLYKLIPISFIKSGAMVKYFFTLESADDKITIRQTIKDSDIPFLRWAIAAILNWNNTEIPTHYIHIHGTKDKTLPMRFTKPTHVVHRAGHLLVLNKAAAINAILKDAL